MKNLLTISILLTLVSFPAFAFDPPPQGAFPPPPFEHGHMFKKHDRMLKKIDNNEDGFLTKDEVIAFHTEEFLKMDGNNDGKVTEDEISAFHKSRMNERLKKKFCDE